MRSSVFYSNPGTIIFLIIVLSISLQAEAQTTSEGTSHQFLYSDFLSSKVKMRNGQIHVLNLNYNTISEMMVYQKDDKLYDLANPEMTDTVFLGKSKFVPAGRVFYEVLLLAPVPLFVQYKGELVDPGTPAGYGVNSKVSNTKSIQTFEMLRNNVNRKIPSDYEVKTDLIYWFRKGGSTFSFINEKQFLKVFPDNESELKQFIKQNRIKFDRPSDIIKLAVYLNNIIQ